jgi:hypothetical protein
MKKLTRTTGVGLIIGASALAAAAFFGTGANAGSTVGTPPSEAPGVPPRPPESQEPSKQSRFRVIGSDGKAVKETDGRDLYVTVNPEKGKLPPSASGPKPLTEQQIAAWEKQRAELGPTPPLKDRSLTAEEIKAIYR